MLTFTSHKIVYHMAYMCFLVYGSIPHCGNCCTLDEGGERQPWIVWQGEFKYSNNARQMVPTLVLFVLILLVVFTGVILLTPDFMDWPQQRGE